MTFSKIDIAKKAVSLVVSIGVTKIVSGIVQNNTSPDRVTDKVAIVTASFVLGTMAADASKKYTDTKVEEIADWISRTFNINVD